MTPHFPWRGGGARPPRIGTGRSDTIAAMKGVPGAPSFLSPLSWTHAGDDVVDIPAVSEDERRASGSTAGTDDHRSSRMRAVAQVKARPPKFLTAVRQLLRGAPALCTSYSTNPLVTAGDDDVETADGDIC